MIFIIPKVYDDSINIFTWYFFFLSFQAPLKLSAPTALMQNANTDATLVCHANKPYDECLWTTPYGKTYTFSDQKSSHEGGRIAYFGFADTDCGVIVRNVQPKDNGGWQCQLHSRNGDIFQNASDVVSLFAGNYKEWKLQKSSFFHTVMIIRAGH